MFTGNVDRSIRHMWDRINLSLIYNCLPSKVCDEDNKDIQATKVILAAREEMKRKPNEEDGGERWLCR